MPGPGAIPPIALRPGAESAGLRAGQSFQAVVRSDNTGTNFVQSGDARINLPADSGLAAGQRVQVSIKGDATGLRVELSPVATASPGGSTAAAPSGGDLAKLVASLLRGLAPGTTAQSAQNLLPTQLPASTAAINPVLQLLLGAGLPSAEFSTVLRSLSAARQAGRLQGPALDAANILLALQATPLEDWPAAVKQALRGAGNEARLAQGGTPMAEDLRSLLQAVLEDDGLHAFLKGQGGLKEFDTAAKSLLSRLDASASNNLHGLDRPYGFAEIPFAWTLGFQRAQMHVCGDGGNEGQSQRKTPATVVLDLSLESLGDLWIQLRKDTASCVCEISADREESRALFESESPALAAQLQEAGMPNPVVRVHAWRVEDRPARLAALLAPARPLDLEI